MGSDTFWLGGWGARGRGGSKDCFGLLGGNIYFIDAILMVRIFTHTHTQIGTCMVGKGGSGVEGDLHVFFHSLLLSPISQPIRAFL